MEQEGDSTVKRCAAEYPKASPVYHATTESILQEAAPQDMAFLGFLAARIMGICPYKQAETIL